MKSALSALRSRHAVALSLILLVFTLLKLPSFFEPYWYGDEGIYLTIGNALNHDQQLYTQIVDHKTPMIYWLARVGGQMEFRILMYVWMLTTITLVYAITRQLRFRFSASVIATTLFMLSTTLPAFEGNIPNGELFVLGFIALGVWLMLRAQVLQGWLEKAKTRRFQRTDLLYLAGAGVAFGLGILTKVPALFDLLGAVSLFYFVSVSKMWSVPKISFRQLISTTATPILTIAGVMSAAVAVILASALYFAALGTFDAYLQFGLLYNFHYAGNWQLSVPAWTEWWFSLPGKAVFLLLLGLGLSALPRRISPLVRWLALWTGLALIASLLSNRPYPHYFLQLFLPLSLLIGWTWQTWLMAKRSRLEASVSTALTIGLVGLSLAAMMLIQLRAYPSISYYQHWLKLITGQQTAREYAFSFNHLMRDNYTFLGTYSVEPGEKMFIWGTNPMLYALTKSVPADKFTVAFHVHDLRVYEQTLRSVRTEQPRIIVVMNDDADSLHGLQEYLNASYRLDAELDHFSVWLVLP